MSLEESGDDLVERALDEGPPRGFAVTVEAFLAEHAIGDQPPGTVRVRKLLWRNGNIVCKWGLSWVTGEWLPVDEGAPYPDECFLQSGLGLVKPPFPALVEETSG